MRSRSLSLALLALLALLASPFSDGAALAAHAAAPVPLVPVVVAAVADYAPVVGYPPRRSAAPAVQAVRLQVLTRASPPGAGARTLPPPAPLVVRGLPCAGVPVNWPAVLTLWTVPSGCYGTIYTPNPAQYVPRPGYGWCSWWPEVLHPELPAAAALALPVHAAPIVGAVLWFPPGVEGAGADGHYAVVVAIGPGGWLLISEMNFSWRGGGFGRVDFRYVREVAGLVYRY